eukprot:5994285-Alexandrium_andersonii.AAC.1
MANTSLRSRRCSCLSIAINGSTTMAQDARSAVFASLKLLQARLGASGQLSAFIGECLGAVGLRPKAPKTAHTTSNSS